MSEKWVKYVVNNFARYKERSRHAMTKYREFARSELREQDFGCLTSTMNTRGEHKLLF